MSNRAIIGKRERADLVVQTVGIFHLYIYIVYISSVRHPTAHALVLRASFYRENMKYFSILQGMSVLTLTLQEVYASKQARGGRDHP